MENVLNDHEKLIVFLNRVERISASTYITNPTQVSWGFEVNKDTPVIKKSLVEPPEEILKSFLLDFRPFISKKEPVYLDGIYNICERRLLNDKFKLWLQQSRELWRKAHNLSPVRLKLNDHTYAPEEIANIWINGWYFHDDIQKYEALKTLDKISFGIHKAEFHYYLEDCIKQILYTGNVVKTALDDDLFDFEK
jgi:hypothetical protein